MICELCGNEVKVLSPAIFEGARVDACNRCIRDFGLAVVKRGSELTPPRFRSKLKLRSTMPQSRRSAAERLEDYMLAEGYGKIIKKARETRGLTQETLARLVREKTSVIRNLELERLTPPPPLVRKLENVLKIKLIEGLEKASFKEVRKIEARSPTLGDIAVFKEEEEER